MIDQSTDGDSLGVVAIAWAKMQIDVAEKPHQPESELKDGSHADQSQEASNDQFS
ncbi:MAG: hypothetical protein KF851_01160 [Pirellulaceae bacterium]|nr:hypothetical protein [Pirellulaceae bacterium]